jgi:hypothetical protein
MIVMPELIYELSDSELDAIAGGQVNVIGNLNVSQTTNATVAASVSNSINSTASANANVSSTITLG